jgi:hypothetical protein
VKIHWSNALVAGKRFNWVVMVMYLGANAFALYAEQAKLPAPPRWLVVVVVGLASLTLGRVATFRPHDPPAAEDEDDGAEPRDFRP